MTAIVISSFCLPFDNPLNNPDGKTQKALNMIAILLTILFLIEATIKSIALGLVFNGPKSYLR